MNFRLIATLAVAGTTTSLASASVHSNVNPKTAPQTYTQSQSSASALQSTPSESDAARTARKLVLMGGSTNPMVQGGTHGRGNPTGTGGTLPIVGGDDCSAAVPVVGVGTFPFDTTGATSGSPALPCGLGGSDVWFSWVAPSTGTALFTLCNGTTADSVIAAWAGSGCPGGTALACNDDTCNFQSQVTFQVTSGSSYMLQIGGFNGQVIGAGTFDLSIIQPPAPCTPWDDGSTENLLGWTAGGDMVWLNRFGAPGQQNTVGSVDVAWGSVMFPGYSTGKKGFPGTWRSDQKNSFWYPGSQFSIALWRF